jgi:hypothetical protein
MKTYFSILDIHRVDVLPQGAQHQIINSYVEQLGGSTVFYTTESHYTYSSLQIAFSKLREAPALTGFAFLTIQQLFSKAGFHHQYIEEALNNGYEVHFVADKLAFTSKEDFKEHLPIILTYYQDKVLNQEQRLSRTFLC